MLAISFKSCSKEITLPSEKKTKKQRLTKISLKRNRLGTGFHL